jgi:hypothetical protein
VSSTAGSGSSGMSPRSTPSGAKSNRASPSCTAPWPSDIAWWSFMISAARPPGSPSRRVARHSGRSRSKSAMLCRRASSRTSAHVEPFGMLNLRMWNDRSKSGSTTSRGVCRPMGPSTTRDRSTGASRVARSKRCLRASQSGLDSRTRRPIMVDRITGSSVAMRHVAKSQPDRRLASTVACRPRKGAGCLRALRVLPGAACVRVPFAGAFFRRLLGWALLGCGLLRGWPSSRGPSCRHWQLTS